MIMTKDQLKTCLAKEKTFYVPATSLSRNIKNYLLNGLDIQKWKYVKSLRKLEYYYANRNRSILYAMLNLFYARKFNKLGLKLGIELERGVFDEGLMIFHTVGIVINGDAKIGKNCKLHGGNVIGNKGNDLGTPVIGDNVRLGTGAKVLGNVFIADDIQIGAGAVVVHSCYKKGALLVGIPAKEHIRSESKWQKKDILEH